MIAIIDYGMGNLRSVQKGFERVGREAVVTNDAKTILSAGKVVLPGVGAFPDCMRNLEQNGLIDVVHQTVRSGKPFLGICLGLQLLFTESEEFGISKGLDIIKGRVKLFKLQDSALKVPHMGWNSITIKRRAPALQDVPDNSHVYFVHSFHVVPEDKNVIATTTDYGIEFVSSIWKDNIFAVQFHPEKSQALGLSILKRFGEQKA
ncbi:MAG: imidazole glycerol phosphate synthase, glutamine amidotransferase subunit [Nitrospirae bacterium GWC2_56_14]|nr:MAG: imidazole glycerol phosphate synthase, glutamine amidotransferase subunit [Nitrospirae bacterium GWC2_56_14]